MQRITILLIVLLTAVSAAVAGPLSAARQQEVVAQINRTAAATKHISCQFTQVKHLHMLNDRLEAKGRMYFSQPNKLRWEYTTPYQYLFILSGSKVYVGSNGRHDVIDTDQNRVFKEIARIMMSTVTGTALSNTKDFAVSVSDNGQQWQVTLTPKKGDLRKMFRSIVLDFAKSTSLVQALTINEKNGDHTDIRFNNLSTTAPVNASLFNIPNR